MALGQAGHSCTAMVSLPEAGQTPLSAADLASPRSSADSPGRKLAAGRQMAGTVEGRLISSMQSRCDTWPRQD